MFSLLLVWANCWRISRDVFDAMTLMWRHTLKRKCLHFDDIFIAGCNGSFQSDNFQFSQRWRHFREWHDDVIKWKHFPRYWPFVRGIHRWPVNSPYKGQWRGALMFSLICAWINGWVNNREAGDLRCHRAHCDVIVMDCFSSTGTSFDWNNGQPNWHEGYQPCAALQRQDGTWGLADERCTKRSYGLCEYRGRKFVFSKCSGVLRDHV